jgi:hypothetical protein
VSAAWNAGKVLLPRNSKWLDAFVAEVCGFTGVGDRRDDQVDALASAFARIGWGTLDDDGGCIIVQRAGSEFNPGRARISGSGHRRAGPLADMSVEERRRRFYNDEFGGRR